jgi:hypothetical protein
VGVAAASVALIAALWVEAPTVPQLAPDDPVKVERLDAEQVERTLEDLDMLKQLGPKVGATQSTDTM